MTEISEFVTLVNHEDYEILTTYPHTIRRKDNHHVCSETLRKSDGYLIVTLNRKTFLKHRLVASQFIDNPNNLSFVDHINHDRTDNRIENIRWVSNSTNNFNKSSNKGIQYEFVDDIPDEAIKVLFYNTRTERHEFEENKYYYYHNENDEEVFYSKMTDTLYRIMHINTTKKNTRFIAMRDSNNKQVSVCINRFKHQHSLD